MEDALYQTIKTWWSSLSSRDRARLRCANTLSRVSEDVSGWSLYAALKRKGFSVGEEQAFFIAGILAHLRECDIKEEGSPLGTLFARASNGGRPKISQLRMQGLLKTKGRAQAYRLLSLYISQVEKGSIDMKTLVRDLWYFGPIVQKRWARDYFLHV